MRTWEKSFSSVALVATGPAWTVSMTRPINVNATQCTSTQRSQMPTFRHHWAHLNGRTSPWLLTLQHRSPPNQLAPYRLRRLRQMKELINGGGSNCFPAMDRIIAEGSGKYHYTAIQLTIRARRRPSLSTGIIRVRSPHSRSFDL